MKKVFCFLLIAALLIPVGAYAETDASKYDLFQRISSVSEVNVDDEFELTYDVAFKSIPVEEVIVEKVVSSDKEVVLIIDTSGSMRDDVYGDLTDYVSETRMEIVKDTALTFIDRFRDDESTKIAVVTYSSSAKKNERYGKSLLSMNNQWNVETLEDAVNDASPSGGTNIGDALRIAKEILDTEGDEKSSKYVITMTDGIPTAFTLESINYKSANGNSNTAIGMYQSDSGYTTRYVKVLNSAVLKYGQGDATKWYVNYGTRDSNGLSAMYAKKMAREFNDTDIKTTFIAFADHEAGYKLQSIAAQCKGEFYNAVSASGLESIYEELSDKVEQDIAESVTYTQVAISETIPTGFDFIEYDDTIQTSGQRFYKNVGDVIFYLNDEGTAYEANPIQLMIKLQAITPGAYLFGKGTNAGYTQYVNLKGESKCDYFGEMFFIVKDNEEEDVTYESVKDKLGPEIVDKLDDLDFDVDINVSEPGNKKIGAPLVAYKNMLEHVDASEVNQSLRRTKELIAIFGEDFDLTLGEGNYLLNDR